jgi:hypothetical protein
MMATHRFPKWMAGERFEILHSPALDQPFGVVLFDRVSARFYGHGHSIAEAAKAAQKKREGINQETRKP